MIIFVVILKNCFKEGLFFQPRTQIALSTWCIPNFKDYVFLLFVKFLLLYIGQSRDGQAENNFLLNVCWNRHLRKTKTHLFFVLNGLCFPNMELSTRGDFKWRKCMVISRKLNSPRPAGSRLKFGSKKEVVLRYNFESLLEVNPHFSVRECHTVWVSTFCHFLCVLPFARAKLTIRYLAFVDRSRTQIPVTRLSVDCLCLTRLVTSVHTACTMFLINENLISFLWIVLKSTRLLPYLEPKEAEEFASKVIRKESTYFIHMAKE